MEENMQTTRERITESHLTSHCDSNRFPAPADEMTRNNLISKPSPGFGAATRRPEPDRQYPTGRDLLKRKCPLWLKRKGTASSPQGQAASKSRLCMEATHESPIQAVRKPATRGLDSDEESTQGKRETSLLRKLLCLKATPPRLKKPPHGPRASPLCRASARCGPMAALSRAADPQGESPLRWKPRAGTPSPAETTSIAEAEAETIGGPGGSWVTKPWRAFRARIASRTKKRPLLPGKGDLGLPTEPETSHITGAKSSTVAVEDKKPPSSAFPSKADDDTRRAQEGQGGHGCTRQGREIYRRAGDSGIMSGPLTGLEAEKASSLSSLENSHREQDPVLKNTPEWISPQTRVCDLPGGEAEAAAMEDDGPEQGNVGYWAEVSAGEEQDLADLAENPGGQGMVMATRDLGWLNSELLGGPTIRKVERERHISTGSHPEVQETEQENAFTTDTSRENKHTGEPALGLITTSVTSTGSYFLPPPASESDRSRVISLGPYDTSGADNLAESGTPFPGSPQEGDPFAPLELSPTFPSRGLERGFQEGLLSWPISKPYQAAGREGSRRQGSPARKLPLSAKETHEAMVWRDATGPEGERDKRLIYRAAVEIVGAAIDVATEQLAKKEGQERAGLKHRRVP